MKTLLALVLICPSLEAFASRSWKRSDLHTKETAETIEEYRSLRAKYPKIFIQEINEHQFYKARVETFGWTYVGSTSCEPGDERLEATTHKSMLCLKDASIPIPLCTFNKSPSLKDEDPCRN